MIETVFVVGRFVDPKAQKPVNGLVEMIPSRLWVDDDEGTTYATLCSAQHTTGGSFKIPVTACHQRAGDYGWHYTVRCPMGTWSIQPDGEDGQVVRLADMLPRKYV